MRASLAIMLGLAMLPPLGAGALANDSTAMLGAGGLVLTKNADIAMRSEDLYISPKQVRVRYVFVNESGHDIDALVAFPLPDIDLPDLWEAPYGAMSDDPVNFVGFEASTDGHGISVSSEQRAWFGGRDVTAEVQASGLPVNLATEKGGPALDALTTVQRARLKAQGLVDCQPQTNEIRPNWTVKTKFFWRQHFPAGEPVAITHRYAPVTGQSFFSEADLKPVPDDDGMGQFVGPYCMDAATRAFARRRLAEGSHFPGAETAPGLLVAMTTDYILTTANNWKGPIGRFHLTVDKRAPSNVLSLCWDGALRKTGPTTFEAAETDFVPKRDLKMLVLQ